MFGVSIDRVMTFQTKTLFQLLFVMFLVFVEPYQVDPMKRKLNIKNLSLKLIDKRIIGNDRKKIDERKLK